MKINNNNLIWNQAKWATYTKENYPSNQVIADKLGISRMSLLNKINGHTEFRLSELVKLQELLPCLEVGYKNGGVIFFIKK